MPKRNPTGTLKKLPTVTLIMAIYPIIYLLQPGASLANQRSATGYPLPLLWFCKKTVNSNSHEWVSCPVPTFADPWAPLTQPMSTSYWPLCLVWDVIGHLVSPHLTAYIWGQKYLIGQSSQTLQVLFSICFHLFPSIMGKDLRDQYESCTEDF